MRDDTARWDTPVSLSYSSSTLNIAEVELPAQFWVSGTDVLARFKDQSVRWPDVVGSDTYALTLRRDRVLLVGRIDMPLGYASGSGLAVSDVSDAFQVIEISGPAAFERLCHGAELDLRKPSSSVMRRAFGAEVMLYRFGDDTRFRMHVPRAGMQSVFRQLVG